MINTCGVCFSGLNCLQALRARISFGIVEYCSIGGEGVKTSTCNMALCLSVTR